MFGCIEIHLNCTGYFVMPSGGMQENDERPSSKDKSMPKLEEMNEDIAA
jgi:hypothetical protein